MELNRSLIELGAPLPPAQLANVTDARGLVVFLQGGSGSGRINSSVAARLQMRQLDTLLLDLLTEEEHAQERSDRVHVDLLTERLFMALDALAVPDRQRETAQAHWRTLPLGLMAADIYAAAGLRAAAHRPKAVRALVARGGRLDLAADVLGDLNAPTLLLAGAADPEMVEISRAGFARLRCEKRIELVPRATRLFLEAGTLDDVAQRAGDWFSDHLAAAH
jgi:putative phosphoribosyl transferase